MKDGDDKSIRQGGFETHVGSSSVMPLVRFLCVCKKLDFLLLTRIYRSLFNIISVSRII